MHLNIWAQRVKCSAVLKHLWLYVFYNSTDNFLPVKNQTLHLFIVKPLKIIFAKEIPSSSVIFFCLKKYSFKERISQMGMGSCTTLWLLMSYFLCSNVVKSVVGFSLNSGYNLGAFNEPMILQQPPT